MIQICGTCGTKPHSQDELHGKSNRVFNEVPLKSGGRELRCTVCNTKHVSAFKATPVEKKKEKATA